MMYPPPPLSKPGLVRARRPRVTVVLMGFSDRGFCGQKFNAWWLRADCGGKEGLGHVCDGFSCSQQHSDWYCKAMQSVFLISRGTALQMRSLILILNLIMIVALILNLIMIVALILNLIMIVALILNLIMIVALILNLIMIVALILNLIMIVALILNLIMIVALILNLIMIVALILNLIMIVALILNLIMIVALILNLIMIVALILNLIMIVALILNLIMIVALILNLIMIVALILNLIMIVALILNLIMIVALILNLIMIVALILNLIMIVALILNLIMIVALILNLIMIVALILNLIMIVALILNLIMIVALILNLIMIVALILTWSSSLLMIHRLAQILGRTVNCSLYGPKQGPSCFLPPSDASVQVNTQLWLAEMYGFPATFHWVQVKVGGRNCQGLVPLEYVQPPRAKVQAPLKHVFATMTAQMHRCAVHQSSQCPRNGIAQPQRATKCVLCSRTTCVQGTRVICIGVRCSRWRAGCAIKWQTDKKPSSHSIADVFPAEAAAWAAFDSIASSDSASEALLYPESDHKATDPQTSLR